MTRPSTPEAWQSRGACRDHHPDLFFPSDDAPAELIRVQEATAKAVCRSCPVAGVCLSTALAERMTYGVWGGLSADDRKAVLAIRSRPDAFTVTATGTSAVTGRTPSGAGPAPTATRAAGPRSARRATSRGIVRGRPVAITPCTAAVSA